MTDDLVSVVIPCFNASRYIAAAIRSVQEQHWKPLEIIVVDDGSTDGSAELVASAFPEVRLIRQANQGAAAARNHGVRQASGTWIAFLDADDIWLPGKLAAQADKLLADPGARVVYTAWQVWAGESPSPDAAELQALLAGADEASRWEGPSGWIYPDLLLDCALWTSTVMAHRSVFDEVGVFDTSLRIGEDYDLWLRVSRITRILRVNRPFALYRAHPASITRTAPLENYRSIVVSRALARWGYGHEPAGTAVRARVRRALAHSWSDFAASNLAAGHFDRARHGALMALRTDPTHVPAWKVLIKTAVGTLVPALARESS
jgi:glycosyltransferase involved in cell wall biosynthesis